MVYVISDACVSCGICAKDCPVGAISEGSPYVVDPDTCIDCGVCEVVCIFGAIAAAEEGSGFAAGGAAKNEKKPPKNSLRT